MVGRMSLTEAPSVASRATKPARARPRRPEVAGDATEGRGDGTERRRRRQAPRAAVRRVEVTHADLNHALLLAKERGHEVPCLGPGREAWTSDDYDDQQTAADRCYDCPAMLLCRAYAEAAGEKAGTWGGETLDPARKPPRNPASAQADRARRAAKRGVPTQPPTSKSRNCTCACGGWTRGGRYLPGHDSLHLQRLSELVRNGAMTLDRAMGKLAESPALQAKLLRRVGR